VNARPIEKRKWIGRLAHARALGDPPQRDHPPPRPSQVMTTVTVTIAERWIE
jgi:hypothetical protein